MMNGQASTYLQLVGALFPPIVTAAVAWWLASRRERRRAQRAQHSDFFDLKQRVIQIQEQVLPNGGKSLRDSVNRIERNQAIDRAWAWVYHDHDDKPLWEADAQGSIIRCNLAFAKILGVSVEDLRGFGWLSMVHPDDADAVKEELRGGTEFGHHLHLEYRAHRPGRLTLRIRTRWRRVPDPTQESLTTGYVGTILESVEQTR